MLANESQEVPVNLVCDICLNRAMHYGMAKQSCVLYILQRAHAFINKTNLTFHWRLVLALLITVSSRLTN